MNVTLIIINKPNIISEAQTVALEKVDEFPFQSARALRLKDYTKNSLKYNFV
jgi:hypothetical protein